MAEIQPFRGVLYRVPEADLAKVLAPPYDVIPPAYQAELYARDPRNIVRVVLNREEGDAGYDERREHLPALARGGRPRGGRARPRSTSSSSPSRPEDARCGVRPAGPLPRRGRRERVILPHEHTRKRREGGPLPRPEGHPRQLQPHLPHVPRPGGPLLDPGGRRRADARRPSHYTDDAGVGHRLWRSPTRRPWAPFQRLLATPKAYIADGHHRHATALRYRDEVGPDGAWTLGYFTPMEAPGLLVLPYHRILVEGPSLDEARARFEAGRSASPSRRRAEPRRASRPPRPRPTPSAWPAPAAALSWPRRCPPRSSSSDRADPAEPARPRHLLLPPGRAGARPLGREDAVSYVHSLAEAEEARRRGRLPPGRAHAWDAGRARSWTSPRRGGVDARQEHLLPPEAAVGPGDPPARRLSGRLAASRAPRGRPGGRRDGWSRRRRGRSGARSRSSSGSSTTHVATLMPGLPGAVAQRLREHPLLGHDQVAPDLAGRREHVVGLGAVEEVAAPDLRGPLAAAEPGRAARRR